MRIQKVKRGPWTVLPRKIWLSAPRLFLAFNVCSVFLAALRLAASRAFLRCFSSSESEASSSDSYSATTCQPSLLLSVILISFCLFRRSCLASRARLLMRSLLGQLRWVSVSMFSKIEAIAALSSNCFWLPLDFNRTTSLASVRSPSSSSLADSANNL